MSKECVVIVIEGIVGVDFEWKNDCFGVILDTLLAYVTGWQ